MSSTSALATANNCYGIDASTGELEEFHSYIEPNYFSIDEILIYDFWQEDGPFLYYVDVDDIETYMMVYDVETFMYFSLSIPTTDWLTDNTDRITVHSVGNCEPY